MKLLAIFLACILVAFAVYMLAMTHRIFGNDFEYVIVSKDGASAKVKHIYWLLVIGLCFGVFIIGVFA